MDHKEAGLLTDAIFIAFSIESLQTTQNYGCKSIGEFPFCIPSRRMAFERSDGSPGSQPSHSNAIVYIPGTKDRRKQFNKTFQDLGIIINL